MQRERARDDTFEATNLIQKIHKNYSDCLAEKSSALKKGNWPEV
jgi:hypothetical protein